MIKRIPLTLCGTLFCFSTWSQQSNNQQPVDSLVTTEIPTVTILGQTDHLFHGLPGSVKFISANELKLIQPLSGNEVFRRIPGVHVVDEEGMGMRINIGIRGLDPDRSRSVLILEDGVPVSLNPYGEPEMYYTPPIDRMEGVEVIKGSGQILFGPQTIGGVVNYITAPAPLKPTTRIRFTGGQGLNFSGYVSHGGTYKNVGFNVGYLRKQAEHVGSTWFRINDIHAKVQFRISDKSRILFKLGYYDELSNSTYIGLTQTMYNAGNQDFVQMAPDDLLKVQRISASVSHEVQFNPRWKLTTTGFFYTTTRDWRRQDFRSTSGSKNTGVVWGDTAVANGAIWMQATSVHRDRQFQVAGIEPRVSYNTAIGKMTNKLDLGARFMYEQAFEQTMSATSTVASSGALSADEIRTGKGLALYVQDQLKITKRFSVTAGVRGEFFWFERNIVRVSGKDTNIVGGSEVMEVIPGIGLNYSIGSIVSIFGGVHRGFAPPRVKDAISGSGLSYDLAPEHSWNFELGARANITKYMQGELTGYFMDFSNQIIPVSQSSGGAGSGLVNGGATRHYGLESSVNVDFAKAFGWKDYVLSIDAGFTYTIAQFASDRFIVRGADTVNISGNTTPYAPKILLTSALTFQAPFGLGVRVNGTYVSSQFADELNTVMPTADGRVGEIPAYFTLDASVYYKVPKINLTFRVNMKNITDERYIASRRPQGIRVGLPRWITAGFEFNF